MAYRTSDPSAHRRLAEKCSKRNKGSAALPGGESASVFPASSSRIVVVFTCGLDGTIECSSAAGIGGKPCSRGPERWQLRGTHESHHSISVQNPIADAASAATRFGTAQCKDLGSAGGAGRCAGFSRSRWKSQCTGIAGVASAPAIEWVISEKRSVRT